jgi:hypothetical protein
MAANDWNSPEIINALQLKVLEYFVIPLIRCIQSLSETYLTSSLHLSLPLLTLCQIGIVAEVESLPVKDALDSINITQSLSRKPFLWRIGAPNERNVIDCCDFVDKFTSWEGGDLLLACDEEQEAAVADADHSYDSVTVALHAALVFLGVAPLSVNHFVCVRSNFSNLAAVVLDDQLLLVHHTFDWVSCGKWILLGRLAWRFDQACSISLFDGRLAHYRNLSWCVMNEIKRLCFRL